MGSSDLTSQDTQTGSSGGAGPDDAPRVRTDRQCVGCGYNLRTLTYDASCPECSTPVKNSLMGDLLVFANPRWLRRILMGLYLVCAGLFFPIFACIVLLLGPSPIDQYDPSSLAFGAAALTGILISAGFWLFASMPPIRHGKDLRRRKIMRISSLLALLLIYASAAGRFVSVRFGVPFLVSTGTVFDPEFIALLAIVVAMLTSISYAQHIGSRSSSPYLADVATFLFWSLGVLTSVWLLSATFLSTTSRSAMNDVILLLGGCGAVGLGLAYVGLVLMLARAIRRDLRDAQSR